MTKYNVTLFESDTTQSVGEMVGSFIQGNNVSVINVSHSSVYDQENKQIIFSIALAYKWEE